MFASSKTASVSGGYQISRSLRFNESDTTYLNRTPASTGSRRTYTFSAWIKRSKTGSDSDTILASMPTTPVSAQFRIFFQTSSPTDTLRIFSYDGSFQFQLVTTQVFRDFSAWGHLVLAIDTTQATNTDRVKVYWNGSQITSFGTATYPSQNADLQFNQSGQPHSIGNTYYVGSTSGMYNGYMTEMNFIDGQQLTPSSFGETNAQTGVWQPKAYSGSYGTNGFYLNFSDNSNTTAATLGKDYSGNGNNWTPNNFSVTAGAGNDSLFDTPTPYGVDTGAGGEVRGNYCTFNPLFKLGGTTALTWALNGNLQAKSDSNASMVIYGTIGLDPSTKFYNEFTMTNTVEGADHVGIVTDIQAAADSGTCVAYRADGQKIVNGTVSSYGASYTDNDIIGIAVNLVDNQVTFYKNGTSQGTITGVTSGTYFHRVRFNNVAGQQTEVYGNWGQRAFSSTAPSGFKALCTQNLPTPTIGATTATQAGKFFNPVLWTGDSTNPRTITGVGFQPDWVWVKRRNAATNHFLQDAVRGVTSTNSRSLVSNNTDAETNYYTVNGGVTAFTSDGFTTSGGVTNLNINESGQTYVAWNWKANGSGSTNTSGSITSTVSANTTSGFSIVTYTGTGANATVGHGLGVAPTIIFIKNRSTGSTNWVVYNLNATTNVPSARPMYLNGGNAEIANADIFNYPSTNTTTVFNIGTNAYVNTSSNNYVAYCWTPIAGYSAMNIFTGNGSADGPFVYCGFKPAYVLIKDTTNNGDWFIWDTARDTYNVSQYTLFADLSSTESSGSANYIDILSNGFKVRATTAGFNSNADKFLFMAFATSPFKYSLAR